MTTQRENHTITELIVYVLEHTEKEVHSTSQEKKELALNMLKILINNLDEDDNKIFLLSALETGSISDMIDLTILASKGKLKINKFSIKKLLRIVIKCFSL